MVKITAYDFSIYGGLEAEVENISADTITDERGESFFRVRVRTKDNSLDKAGEPLPIIPGMTTQVDVLTGQKTVLDYLLKPILKVRDQALRER
jgi:adhesin transport system membrane fusion protein